MPDINFVEPLSKELVDKMAVGEVLKKDFDATMVLIQERANYIVDKIGELTGRDSPMKDYPDMLAAFEHLTSSLDFYIYGAYPHDLYSRSFPTRFLWSDFEDEVAAQFEQATAALQTKKAEQVLLQEKRLQLCFQVFDKLTPEERSVVSFPSEFKAALDQKKRAEKHAHNMRMKELHRPEHNI